MHVPPSGSAPGNFEPFVPPLRGVRETTLTGTPAAASPLANITGDQVAALLQLLAAPEISRILTGGPTAETTARSASLLPLVAAAESALSAGNIPAALGKIREIVTIDPEQAEPIPNNPSFSNIRHEVAEVVRVLIADAKVNAEEKIAASENAIAVNGSKRLPGSGLELARVHDAATQLYDSGRLVDYIRSAQLAQFVIANYAPFQTQPSVTEITRRLRFGVQTNVFATGARLITGVKVLWSRAPLLVLLLGWLLSGVAFGLLALAFGSAIADAYWSTWALGFLALVGFGFYMRIRNIRR